MTTNQCGHETNRWHKFQFLWREDKEGQVQKLAALSTGMPDAFEKRFYFYT